MKKNVTPKTQRGSALLIVLGFLSFMMISAVSFAIYMRIERQASSNYRHATTARHMLNAALYRAIDEIDGELRIDKVNGEKVWVNGSLVNVDVRPRKFPEWPGHVKPSAVPNGMDNNKDARVLSSEALSFVPARFVNDVRRYAVSNRNDQVSGVDLKNNKYSYLGAKWRTISMPVNSIVEGENSLEEAVVGRYAYLCVNLSDMLDVNVCKASYRDASTNRVSIGHLFENDTYRKAFDDYVDQTGLRFETLQDFYACMHQIGDPTFGSPYHTFMANDTPSKPDISFEQMAGKHILATDAVALAQPAYATACNILLQQPFKPSDLSAQQVITPLTFQNNSLYGRDGFQTALEKAFNGRLPGGANLTDVFPTLLADYIDTDNIPKMLNFPSVEAVPMISQITILGGASGQAPQIELVDEADDKNKSCRLNLLPKGNILQLSIEVAWPYKRLKDRTCPASSDYDIEVTAYFKIHYTHAAQMSSGFSEQPGAGNGYLMTLKGTVKAPNFSSKNDDDPKACYQSKNVDLTPLSTTPILTSTSDGTPIAPFTANPISVSLVVFARVKLGTVYVDSAPQMLPYPGAKGVTPDIEFMLTMNKLFFQTSPLVPIISPKTKPALLPYEWWGLEVPDARFNHNASNWLKSNVGNNGDINASTQPLLGHNGRDGDIFLSVSNAGKLQSPGELGFIVRPYKPSLTGNAVDFRTRNAVDPNVDESDYYFRTVRLYDHDNSINPGDKINTAQDPVYDYLTYQNSDGSVPGARINPLSDTTLALTAAVELTPTDYWFASLDGKKSSDRAKMTDNTYNKVFGSDWKMFTNGWAKCLNRLRTDTPTVKMLPQRPAGDLLKTSWQYGLPDYYGRFDVFGWYSDGPGNENKIFASGGFSTTLGRPLHEIDRKMLYSFSLDSFSDRQQLFLFILRAEVTTPSFGTSQESDTKSLAGGRAVALVWRDPYPVGYDKQNNTWTKNSWYNSFPKRLSPWYQVNVRKYDQNKEEYNDPDPTIQKVTSALGRFDGYHQYKILYFKQLEN